VATTSEILIDTFERVRSAVHETIDGLDQEQLKARPAANANSIGWMVWHLTRVQDDHIAGLADREQAWLSDGWCDRFALPYEREAHGYGQTPEETAAVDVSAELLGGYYEAVHKETCDYIATLTEDDFDRVVDDSWDPPVTLGVRIVSVIADDLQHVGQAAYVRGLVE
jgi:uncharacterized damage-inducible protein DinB